MPTKNSDFLRDVRYDQFLRNHNALCQICGNLVEYEEEPHFYATDAREDMTERLMPKIFRLPDGGTVASCHC